MQCPACQFNNMPGPPECVSCGALMEAPPGELFLPPRPTSWQKSWRRLHRRPVSQEDPEAATRRHRRQANASASLRWLRNFVNPDPAVPIWRDSPVVAALLSAALPGSGHLYKRQLKKGLPALAAAVVLGLVTTRYLYVPLGTWTMGFYCMLGGWAVFDCALHMPRVAAWQRFLMGLAIVGAILLCLTPVAESLNGLWPTFEVTIATRIGPFPAGSTLEFERHAYDVSDPAIGDLVFTRDRQINIVLGVPGDVVNWDTRDLRVNGELRPGIAPLRTEIPAPSFHTTLPAHRYLVLPRALGDAVGDRGAYQDLVIPEAQVPLADILYRYKGSVPVDSEATRAKGEADGSGANPLEVR